MCSSSGLTFLGCSGVLKLLSDPTNCEQHVAFQNFLPCRSVLWPPANQTLQCVPRGSGECGQNPMVLPQHRQLSSSPGTAPGALELVSAAGQHWEGSGRWIWAVFTDRGSQRIPT